MTVHDLRCRGFRLNRHIPAFVGWCQACLAYRLIDWFAAPRVEGRLGGEVTACRTCEAVDRRDAAFVRGYPVAMKDGAGQPPERREQSGRMGCSTSGSQVGASSRDAK
jgi:hypothetical protein